MTAIMKLKVLYSSRETTFSGVFHLCSLCCSPYSFYYKKILTPGGTLGRTANEWTRKVRNCRRTLPFKCNNEEMCSGFTVWCNNKPKRLTDEDYDVRWVITLKETGNGKREWCKNKTFYLLRKSEKIRQESSVLFGILSGNFFTEMFELALFDLQNFHEIK